MIILLKIIHFLSFSLAVGGGVSGMVLGIRASRLDASQATTLRQAQGVIGKISLTALILLWITGVWMLNEIFGGDIDIRILGTAFQIKMIAVVILTFVSGYFNFRVFKAKRAGTPTDPQLAKRAGMIVLAMALIAVISAIVAFGPV